MRLTRSQLAAIAIVTILIISSVIVLFNPTTETIVPETNSFTTWLSVNSDSSTPARPGDQWGEMETLSGAPTGTLNYYKNLSLYQNPGMEAVILDGYVWVMMRSNVSEPQAVMRYTPAVQGQSWNFSYECYAPQGNDYFDSKDGAQQFALRAVLIDSQGNGVAAVELSYGSENSSYVRIYDATTDHWTNLSSSILPAYSHRDAVEGQPSDRYIVSFQHVEGNVCNVSVIHTAAGPIGSAKVDLPSSFTPYQLVLYGHAEVAAKMVDPTVPDYRATYSGGWVVDNFACRGGTARYPIVGPTYEYAVKGAGASANRTFSGTLADDAKVTVDGHAAVYNTTTNRYEATLPLHSGWDVPTAYSVSLDGVAVNDSVLLTMVSSAPHASLTEWWNGWSWVSVFGLDDCNGPASALNQYKNYQHPVTAYVMTMAGSSTEILPTQSEIALHYPHEWESGNRAFWKESVSSATSGEDLFSSYAFASRWDDPANGGWGDMFISMANPGNKATYQKMFALYESGVRVDGRSSERGSGTPGNISDYGSWYYSGSSYVGTDPVWYPYRPMDMMDASRQFSIDYDQPWAEAFVLVNDTAQHGGVLRVYGHPGRADGSQEILHWIDNTKTNYSLENWKATDGEWASYVYGRWSTNLQLDPRSTADTYVYDITRADPRPAGYWLVPVTVSVDLGGKTVKDIQITEGDRTLKMSDGSLQDLDGQRVMDCGYDVRDGKLYVSYYWNSSATLTVTFADSGVQGQIVTGSPAMMSVAETIRPSIIINNRP